MDERNPHMAFDDSVGGNNGSSRVRPISKLAVVPFLLSLGLAGYGDFCRPPEPEHKLLSSTRSAIAHIRPVETALGDDAMRRRLESLEAEILADPEYQMEEARRKPYTYALAFGGLLLAGTLLTGIYRNSSRE